MNARVLPMANADSDLETRVRLFFNQHHRPSLRRLVVVADNGVVRLRGKVGSFYEKQICLTCCKHVAGVIKIVDEIKVERKAPVQFKSDKNRGFVRRRTED